MLTYKKLFFWAVFAALAASGCNRDEPKKFDREAFVTAQEDEIAKLHAYKAELKAEKESKQQEVAGDASAKPKR